MIFEPLTGARDRPRKSQRLYPIQNRLDQTPRNVSGGWTRIKACDYRLSTPSNGSARGVHFLDGSMPDIQDPFPAR